MNKLDSFFKKKMEAAAIEPRGEAWAKLESNLSKKNKGLIWLRVAAALLLAGMLLTSIIWVQNKEDEQQMAEELKKEIPTKALDNSQVKTDKINQSTQKATQSIAEDKQTNKKEKKVSKLLTSSQFTAETESEPITPNPIESETIKTQMVAAATVEKPIVIEYTLESVKYLKKDVPVLAETAEKKNSLQKALDFAREAKNSDSPLGEIRQAKDDLFALNFKKDKQKKQ
jgi:hypothetical protein